MNIQIPAIVNVEFTPDVEGTFTISVKFTAQQFVNSANEQGVSIHAFVQSLLDQLQ